MVNYSGGERVERGLVVVFHKNNGWSGVGIRQECCLSPILFNLFSEHLTKYTLEWYGDFKIGGKVIRTVKYVDELVLLTKEDFCIHFVFRYIRKRVSFACLSVRRSVRQHGKPRLKRKDFREIWYLRIFQRYVEKVEVWLKCDKNDGCFTLRLTYFYDNILLNCS